MEDEYKEYRLVCKNPWCKAQFICTNEDVIEKDGKKIYPKECKKCKSFDTELSGGVTWEERHYEGDPWKGAHQISYKVTNYN